MGEENGRTTTGVWFREVEPSGYSITGIMLHSLLSKADLLN